MTNEEIIARILEIRSIKNACDRAIELKKFQRTYKRTKFYKQTRKPLLTLYYEVLVEDTLSLRVILQSVQEFLDTLDGEKLAQIFDEANVKTLDTVREGMNSLQSSDLMELLHSIKSN